MQHRHLNTNHWTRAAIDSAIERGGLDDWRELFAAVRADSNLAREVLAVVDGHHVEGASEMARRLVLAVWPDLRKDRSAA